MEKRLDRFLVDNGFYETREKAQVEIKNNNVSVDGKVVTKPSYIVGEKAKIEILGCHIRYVSRAGLKLEQAQKVFKIDFSDKVVLDIGSSTGGFTDFCVKNGAKKVYAVDVGKNQLHQSLKNNPKVISFENTDIRNLTTLSDEIDIAVCDVSFISLTKIAGVVSNVLGAGKMFIALIKPQFECGKQIAKKNNGVIKDEKIHKQIIEEVTSFYESIGFDFKGITQSPILGGDGNMEFLSFFVKK